MANSGPAPSRGVPGIVLGAALAVPPFMPRRVVGRPVAFTARAVEALIGPLPTTMARMAVRAWRLRPTPADRRSARPGIVNSAGGAEAAASAATAERQTSGVACLASCLPAWRCLPCERRRPSDRPGRHTSIISGSARTVAVASLAGTEISSAIAGTDGASGTGSLAEPSATVADCRIRRRWRPDRNLRPLRPPRRALAARPKLRPPRRSSRLLPAWRLPPASRQATVRQCLLPHRSPVVSPLPAAVVSLRFSAAGSAGSGGFGRRSRR